MKYTCFILLIFLAFQAQAQFAPDKVCKNDKFEISPLTTNSTIKLKALYNLEAQGTKNLSSEHNNTKDRIIELRIFDVFGTMVFRKLLAEDFKEFDIDFSNLSAGAYVVEVRQGFDILSTKIIRRHH